MIRTVIIVVFLFVVLLPVALLAWRIIKRWLPQSEPLPDNPEDFTHLHLDKSMTAVELMAKKNELRDKQMILTNRQQIALVERQIAEADSMLADLQYPSDGDPAVPVQPRKVAQ